MSKQRIPIGQKSITNWTGKYPRALETDIHVFFVNLAEGDENACAFMYKKEGEYLELVSDNYFASVGLQDTFREGSETWMSPAMKKVREYQIKVAILPLVKEYIGLIRNGNTALQRVIELGKEIEEYWVALPDHDVCVFLEEKFKQFLK